MGRPPLILETWGTIRRTTVNGKPTAIAYYRDSDGVTRPMQRQGKTPAAAERNLVQALRDRLTPSDGLSGDSRVSALAEAWWEEYSAKDRAPNTMRRYNSVMTKHIVPGLGGLLIREASVSRLDRFVKTLAEKTGAATARLASVVLSGMFDMAARHDAVRTNPMHSVAPIPKAASNPHAHSLADVAELRQRLREWDATPDKRGMKRTADLADIADLHLATGARPGEVLALRYSLTDLDKEPARTTIAGTVAFDRDGKVHIQDRPKSAKSHRELKLPRFGADVIRRRKETAINDLIFPSSTGTVRAPSNFLTQWHAALKGTRFEGEIPKTFRASVAALIAEMEDSSMAQSQLGHESVKITEKHYIPHRANLGPDATAILELFNAEVENPE